MTRAFKPIRIVTRDQRLLQRALVFCAEMAESDQDARHRDNSLLSLLRAAHRAGYTGPKKQDLAKLADRVAAASIKEPFLVGDDDK